MLCQICAVYMFVLSIWNALKMRPDQERVRNLLTDTVTLLCKNGLQYQTELRVQGVLGITLDNNDVFIVHINEKFGGDIGGAISIRNDEGDAAKTLLDSKKSSHVVRDETPTAVNMPTGEATRRRRRRSHESSPSATNAQRPIKRHTILKDYSSPRGERIQSSLPNVTGCDSAGSADQEFLRMNVKTEVDDVIIVEQSQDVVCKMDDASQNLHPRGEQFTMQDPYSNPTLGEIQGSRRTFGDNPDAMETPSNAGADCLVPPPTKWRATSGDTRTSFGGPCEMGLDGGGPFVTGIIRNETVSGEVAPQTTTTTSWDPSQLTEDISSLTPQDSKMILDSTAGCSTWDTSQSSQMSAVTPNMSDQSSESVSTLVFNIETLYQPGWGQFLFELIN